MAEWIPIGVLLLVMGIALGVPVWKKVTHRCYRPGHEWSDTREQLYVFDCGGGLTGQRLFKWRDCYRCGKRENLYKDGTWM